MPHQCTNCGRTFADGSKEMLSGCPDCGGNKFQFAPGGRGDRRERADRRESGTPDDRPSDGGSSDVRTRSPDERSADSDETLVQSSDDTTASDHGTAASEHGTTASDARTASDDGSASDDGAISRAVDAVRDRVGGASTADGSDGDFPDWPDAGRRPADRSSAEDDARARESDDSLDSGGADVEPSSTGSGDTATEPEDTTIEPEDPTTGTEDTAQADARSEVVPREQLPNPPERDDPDVPPGEGRVVGEPAGDRPSLEDLREELNDQFESIKIVEPGQYELNLMELYDREEYIVSLQEDGRYVIDVPDTWREGSSED